MASRNSLDYLERRRRFVPPAGRGLFATNSLHSHARPVRHLPDLLPPDTPLYRVITQLEAERVPYMDSHKAQKVD